MAPDHNTKIESVPLPSQSVPVEYKVSQYRRAGSGQIRQINFKLVSLQPKSPVRMQTRQCAMYGDSATAT